jgi:hypothetical protein
MKAKPEPKTEAPAFRVTLRIRHPSIDPAELSREFGIEPLHSFRAGDIRPAASRGSGSACHAESYWLADLETGLLLTAILPGAYTAEVPMAVRTGRRRLELLASRNLGLAFSVITLRVLHPRASLLQRLQAEEGEVTLLIELDRDAMESFVLAPQVMRALADLGVTVNFDFGDH